MKIFGFEVGGKKDVGIPTPIISNDPTATLTTDSFSVRQSYATNVKTDSHRTIIEQNRELAQNVEADFAIDEIISSFADFNLDTPFEIRVDNDDDVLPTKLLDVIHSKFKKVSTIFSQNIQSNVYSWYVDGSIAWFIQLNDDGKGINGIKQIEPWLIEKVTPTTMKYDKNGVPVFTEEEQYYIYTQQDSKAVGNNTGGLKIKLPYDSIVYIDSNKYDKNGIPISYIRNAMKPINDMASLEQSLVIYRLTRAPEKRAFYVDTGQLPTQKAEEYVKTLKNRFKSKIDYDTKTGAVKTTNQNVISATVDYWMPRRGGSASTEMALISESGNPLNTVSDELDYFRQKTYMALKIPLSRLADSMSVGLVKSGSVTREELKFAQFVSRLRRSYLSGLYHLLKIELIMSGAMTEDEWNKYNHRILINVISVDYFADSKKLELLTDQLTVLQTMDPYIDRFFSQEYVFKDILNMTDEEIVKMKKQIENPVIGGASEEVGAGDDSEYSEEGDDYGLGDDDAPFNAEEPTEEEPAEEPTK